jgi:hypothetical protein
MVEMVEFPQMLCIVMLESAKHKILGVDNLRQQVSPRVRYGMTYLLIRAAIGCESCSVV